MSLKRIIDSATNHVVDYLSWHLQYLGFHLAVGALFYARQRFFLHHSSSPSTRRPRIRKEVKRQPSRKDKSLDITPPIFLDTSLIPSAITTTPEASSTDEESIVGSDVEISSSERDLKEQIPEATEEECQRFVAVGSIETAIDQLKNYVAWHNKHESIAEELGIPTKASPGDVDVDYWNAACRIAIHTKGEKYSGNLPQVISVYAREGKDILDMDGKRIFHIMPCKMDKKLVTLSTYALATALYLDRRLARDSLERITVCLDVRAGEGLPNLHAAKQVKFMKETSQLLMNLFPERLNKALVYPIPSSFYWVWKMVRTVLDPETRRKVCPLNGPCKIEAAPPRKHMIEHMSEQVADVLEDERIRCFKPISRRGSSRSLKSLK